MKKIKLLLSGAWQQLSRVKVSSWLLAATALPLLALFLVDGWMLEHLRFSESSPANSAARFLSKWGDFYTGCLIAVALVFVWGIFKKKKNLQTLALAMLLSGAVAGLTATTLRFFSGRPRPSSQIADGLYGPRFEKNKKGLLLPSYNYNSLPSAHAATALGTALPALILQPAIGVPLTVAAVAIGWSRFQLARHNPSDIYIGFLLGAFLGVAFARAVRSNSKSST